MGDRIKTTRGRKRAFGKGLPPPSAADLFDSLIQGQDKATHNETKLKKIKRVPSKASFIIATKSATDQESEPEISSEPVGGEADAFVWQQSQSSQASSGGDNSNSPPAGSDDSAGSDDDGPVFMSFGATLDKDSTASPEHSPQKPQRSRRLKVDAASTKLNQGISTNEAADATDDGEDRENSNGSADDSSSKDDAAGLAGEGSTAEEGDTAAGLNKQKSRRSSDAGGVGSLGVSKDVEDSIRKEIENMLANNRFRGSGRGTGGDQETVEANGDVPVSLEEDVILVEAGRKKHCRFLIRRQEDQTPPSSRNYRCFKCPFNTTRMNNMIRHYRRC
ncbi:hypothetical protein BIW11_00869 [Tropilaelaps mercedesae]|uniref:Uncharacterized protein n=1 Tax=Tropilaelaps mercedesae TaxID=418985 RepID=A0A1V9XN51_9ACAR|nr:hypothetical protein BIW11_00869 [Tropilaelaps mercedesae]